MKKNQIFILLYILIPSYLFAQEGGLENPYYHRNIIHKSILLFKKNLRNLLTIIMTRMIICWLMKKIRLLKMNTSVKIYTMK